MTISPCSQRPANCCAVKLRWNAAPALSISERESSSLWPTLNTGKSFCQGQRGAGEPTCSTRLLLPLFVLLFRLKNIPYVWCCCYKAWGIKQTLCCEWWNISIQDTKPYYAAKTFFNEIWKQVAICWCKKKTTNNEQMLNVNRTFTDRM